MIRNEFAKRKAREKLEAHIKNGDWMCDTCTRPGLVAWHAKGERCPRAPKKGSDR